MKSITRLRLSMTALAAVTLSVVPALAQHDHDSQPKHHDEPATAAKADQRVGDPYPFDTCPITGKKLGAMGDPVVKVYDGQEVRFCCPACPEKFEKDKVAGLTKLDEKIVKDQLPLYPLKTSLITGKELPTKPYELVYGNRLIRLGAESDKAEFLRDAKKNMGELDKAVVSAQMKDYPLKTCPVSKDELGGDMGKPVDVVLAGRLIRLCCNGCRKDLEKDPAKFIAVVDAARGGEKTKPDSDHKDHDDKKPDGGK